MNAQPYSGMTKTGIVILAAGSSKRFGKIKQLLHFNGKTLLQHVIDEAVQSGAAPIIVVTGADTGAVVKEIEKEKIITRFNPQWRQGMASGIVSGLKEAISTNERIEKIIIAVCDQPFVTSALFTQLDQVQNESRRHIVASAYAGTIGTPALFTQQYFNALLSLTGDEGAKKIVKRNPDDVAVVDFPQGAIDIDTPKDYDDLLDRQRHVF